MVLKKSLLLLVVLTVALAGYAAVAGAETTGDVEYSTYGPAADELIYTIIKDPDAQMLALKKGDIWVLPDLIRPNDIEDLQAQDNIDLTMDLGFHMFYMCFNMRDGQKFEDKTLRRAISMVIDREQIIMTIYRGYMLPLSTMVPPSSPFYIEDVPVPQYDPEGAAAMLDAAGYVMDEATGVRIDPATGKDLEDMIFLTPTAGDAPTSAELGKVIADAAQAIGIPLKATPTDFNTILDKLDNFDFDAYELAWSLDRYPTYLYDFFHSSQDQPGMYNMPGTRIPELDKAAEGIKYAKTYDEAYDNSIVAQNILADQAAYAPLYSRPFIVGFRNDKVTGYVPMLGYGAESYGNKWTTLNIKPVDPNEKAVKWCLTEEPERLSPLLSESAYEAQIVGMTRDTLLEVDPNTMADIPWLAKSWEVDTWTTPEGNTGSKITFNLNKGVKWSDGSDFTANDVKFSLEYAYDNQVPLYWTYIQDLAKVETPDDYTVVVYFNTESYWHVEDANTVPLINPTIWEGKDFNTFDPLNTPHPTLEGENSYVTLGPFKLVEYQPGEYVRLVKNQNYWRLQQ